MLRRKQRQHGVLVGTIDKSKRSPHLMKNSPSSRRILLIKIQGQLTFINKSPQGQRNNGQYREQAAVLTYTKPTAYLKIRIS